MSLENAILLPARNLGQMQRKFAAMVGLLLAHIYSNGYEVTFGDAWSQPCYRTPRGEMPHKANSLHYDRLAIDLNLFKLGEFLTDTKAHEQFGAYWESIGGSWGGRFGDGNHYSLEYNGRK